jgi:hypothetical protein
LGFRCPDLKKMGFLPKMSMLADTRAGYG